MLNELDKELEARGLRFTRYADDCVIAVRSEASAKRVMRTVTDWITRKPGLNVNRTKTHITRPMKLKERTCRKRPGTVAGKIAKINQVTRGWINYYALGSMKTAMAKMDAYLRTRPRVIIWKVPSKRQWGLQKLGIGKDLARLTSYCGDHYQWVVTRTCVVRAISKAGFVSCLDYYNERHALKLC